MLGRRCADVERNGGRDGGGSLFLWFSFSEQRKQPTPSVIHSEYMIRELMRIRPSGGEEASGAFYVKLKIRFDVVKVALAEERLMWGEVYLFQIEHTFGLIRRFL